MTITDHPFTNTDSEYSLIKKLLLEIEAYPEIDNNWEPGRMDWWRYNSHLGKDVSFFQTHAHYWKTESDQVVALFISEYAKDDFFIVIHPEYGQLIHQVLEWGKTVWGKDKSKISTDVYTYATHKIDQLLAAGFYEDGHIENVRIYPFDQFDFSYDLKPGYQLMRFADDGNYENRVKLVQNAFNNPNFSEARLRSLQSSPNYQKNLDLVIVNDQGMSVAYCMGWLEEINPKVGFIEPMGVHSDFRQNRFGSALAKECFIRMKGLGAESAWIASSAEPHVSNFLYDSLKPSSIKRSYRYTLTLKSK